MITASLPCCCWLASQVQSSLGAMPDEPLGSICTLKRCIRLYRIGWKAFHMTWLVNLPMPDIR